MCINKLIWPYIKHHHWRVSFRSKVFGIACRVQPCSMMMLLMLWWWDQSWLLSFLHSFSTLSNYLSWIYSFYLYVCIQKSVPTYNSYIYFAFSSLSAHEQASRGCRTEQNMKGREKRAFNVGKLDLGREA